LRTNPKSAAVGALLAAVGVLGATTPSASAAAATAAATTTTTTTTTGNVVHTQSHAQVTTADFKLEQPGQNIPPIIRRLSYYIGTITIVFTEFVDHGSTVKALILEC
jgi:hypothetical protein